MQNISVDPTKFKFTALPEYVAYLLQSRLPDYTRELMRIAKLEKLPLLEQLKISDEQLIALSMHSNEESFTAITTNNIPYYIREKVLKWVNNNLEIIDKNEVVAEDISLFAYIKRRALSNFVDDYTSDIKTQKMILCEIDAFTTQEELVFYNTYIKMQKHQLDNAFQNLEFQESLLLEAQEISDIGSFYIDYLNPQNSVYTPQTYKITGIDSGDEASFMDYIHPDDALTVRSLWDETLQRGGPFAYSFRFRNGDIEKKLNARGIVVREDGRVINAKGTLRDISAIDRLIKKLTDSETLHKQAQQLTHLGNWSWTIGNDSVMWSDELYRIYGLEPQSETITFDRFLSLIHPDDRDKRLNEIQESIRTGIVKDYILKIVTPAGEVKILKGHGSVELDAERNPLRLVGTCQDITKEYHLNNELVALNRSLYQKNVQLINSNQELESFNYIASHDLQEPLRKIRMFAGRLAEQSGGLPEAAQQSLNRVIDSAARMQRLIADLIEFSQISAAPHPLEDVSLNALVDEVLENYAENIETDQITFNVQELPSLRVIPFQFTQLMLNLIGNAIKYRKEDIRAEITISSDIVTSTDDPAVTEGRFVRLSICDNGIGFDPDQKDNIFDLFKRLHSHTKFSGTGIGLAICKKIVQNHNGFIKAQSVLGEGSCFYVYLPYDQQ